MNTQSLSNIELNVYDYPADYEELKEEDMAFILTARDAFVTAPSVSISRIIRNLAHSGLSDV